MKIIKIKIKLFIVKPNTEQCYNYIHEEEIKIISYVNHYTLPIMSLLNDAPYAPTRPHFSDAPTRLTRLTRLRAHAPFKFDAP